jgi:hypothetical protein
MDAYPNFGASAVAASQLLRGLAAFGFPIFAPSMYGRLGYGWENSLLALVFIALGVPAPVFLWKVGAKLRAKEKLVLSELSQDCLTSLPWRVQSLRVASPRRPTIKFCQQASIRPRSFKTTKY